MSLVAGVPFLVQVSPVAGVVLWVFRPTVPLVHDHRPEAGRALASKIALMQRRRMSR